VYCESERYVPTTGSLEKRKESKEGDLQEGLTLSTGPNLKRKERKVVKAGRDKLDPLLEQRQLSRGTRRKTALTSARQQPGKKHRNSAAA